jgi:hypothetical protein
VAFRRAYFTYVARLARFYNFQRPHHGYCVRGGTPATIVFGAEAVAR